MESAGRHKNIQSIERAMRLLELISRNGGRARLTELALATGLGKTTIFGMLDTLVGLGYIRREGRYYVLGYRLGAVAKPVSAFEARLKEAFAPALRAFSELTGETALLAVPSGTRGYLTVDVMDANANPVHTHPDVDRDSLTTSAIGKVFLAHNRPLLRRVQRTVALPGTFREELQIVVDQGFAVDLGASESALHCVALPLRIRGNVVAALGAAGSAERLNAGMLQRLAHRAMRDLFDLVKA